MAAVMLGAAALAYRKAAAKTRDESFSRPETPAWLRQFAGKLHEDESDAATTQMVEPMYHKKERLLSKSEYRYERLAWYVYSRITTKSWFETFVMLNIFLIAIATGIDLENEARKEGLIAFTDFVATFTLSVFTIECVLKIVAEAFEPWNYFTDPENGYYNSFDFLIVFLSFVFIDSAGSTISALRMLRLIRLLSFIKNVPQLRMILVGLIQGVKSVAYIVVLLLIVIYICSILACVLFGQNDPAHFGDVRNGMVSLFQVSTLASWTSIAYVSWFGCEDYLGSPYGDENQQKIKTIGGRFQGFKCNENIASPISTGVFFSMYILLTSWVIMSIFIGVISMGMFESYFAFKDEAYMTTFIKAQAENTQPEAALKKLNKPSLKTKIEKALDDHSEEAVSAASSNSAAYNSFIKKCIKIRDSTVFVTLVTLTIILVGIISGLETNVTLRCLRVENKAGDDDDNSNIQDKLDACENSGLLIDFVVYFAQAVFTVELLIKMGAEGVKPLNYFTDDENGSWNCIDFLIVLIGFIELTPISFIFAKFPIVILRMVRLFRVFKLAKALPRLRSIVEALMSSFSSVGWVCVLICSYNYIVGCFFVVFFRENDPFHFGNIGRAMFTVLRMETLDTWDQILYITMYGCDTFPAGYEFLQNYPQSNCEKSNGIGVYGFGILLIVVIVGAYVLPTVLIGIVSIKFDNTSRRIEKIEVEKKSFIKHLKEAREILPDFFTDERVELIRDVFSTLDTNSDTSIDLVEIEPFFQYALAYALDIELTAHQCEALFFFADSNSSTEVGFGEFISFIATVKEMQLKASVDPKYKAELKYQALLTTEGDYDESREENTHHAKLSKWDAAMARVDKETLNLAWETIYKAIRVSAGNNMTEKVLALFKDLDSDGSGDLEHAELGIGLKANGILLNDRQLLSLIHSVDKDGDGRIDLEEFITQIQGYIQRQEDAKKRKEETDIKSAMHRRQSLMGLGDGSTAARTAEVAKIGVSTPEAELQALDKARQAIRDKMAEFDSKELDATSKDKQTAAMESVTKSDENQWRGRSDREIDKEEEKGNGKEEETKYSDNQDYSSEPLIRMMGEVRASRTSIDSELDKAKNVQLPTLPNRVISSRASSPPRSSARETQSQPRPTSASSSHAQPPKRRSGSKSDSSKKDKNSLVLARKPSKLSNQPSPRSIEMQASSSFLNRKTSNSGSGSTRQVKRPSYSDYSKQDLIQRIYDLEATVEELKSATIGHTNTLLRKAVENSDNAKPTAAKGVSPSKSFKPHPLKGSRSIVVAGLDTLEGSDDGDQLLASGGGGGGVSPYQGPRSPLIQALSRIERAGSLRSPSVDQRPPSAASQQSEGIAVDSPRAREHGRSGPISESSQSRSRTQQPSSAGSFI